MFCKDFLGLYYVEGMDKGLSYRQPCNVTRIAHERVLTAQEDSVITIRCTLQRSHKKFPDNKEEKGLRFPMQTQEIYF